MKTFLILIISISLLATVTMIGFQQNTLHLDKSISRTGLKTQSRSISQIDEVKNDAESLFD